MIQISLTTALILYSAVLGMMAAAIWIYTEVTVRRTYKGLGKQYLWRCVFCGFTYLDEGAEEVSQCPRCESFNSVSDEHARYVRAHTPGLQAEALPEIQPEARRNPSRRKRPHQRRRGPRRH